MSECYCILDWDEEPCEYCESVSVRPVEEHIYKSGELFGRENAMYTNIKWDWIDPLSVWIQDITDNSYDNWIIIEVMAGRGFLSDALDKKGINIISTDNYADFEERKLLDKDLEEIEPVFYVRKIDAFDIPKKLPKKRKLIIMSWPNDNESAAEFVEMLPEGTMIVYIGDGDYEVTASKDLEEIITWLDDYPNAYSNALEKFPDDIDVEGVGCNGIIRVGIKF